MEDDKAPDQGASTLTPGEARFLLTAALAYDIPVKAVTAGSHQPFALEDVESALLKVGRLAGGAFDSRTIQARRPRRTP